MNHIQFYGSGIGSESVPGHKSISVSGYYSNTDPGNELDSVPKNKSNLT